MGELKHETILGIDNIPLELPIAGIGSRALAAALDYMILGVALSAVMLTLLSAIPNDSFGLGLALASLAVFLLQWGYFAAFEIGLGGRTPGKAAVGLRVVHKTGGAARPGSVVVRNLLRTVDLLCGAPMIAFDPLSRRLGDWLGATLVVHARRREEIVLGRIPESWGRDEVALAERLVARSDELDPGRAAELSRRLLAVLAHDAPEMVAEHEGYARLEPVDALRRLLAARTVEPSGTGPSPPSPPPPGSPPQPPAEPGAG